MTIAILVIIAVIVIVNSNGNEYVTDVVMYIDEHNYIVPTVFTVVSTFVFACFISVPAVAVLVCVYSLAAVCAYMWYDIKEDVGNALYNRYMANCREEEDFYSMQEILMEQYLLQREQEKATQRVMERHVNMQLQYQEMQRRIQREVGYKLLMS